MPGSAWSEPQLRRDAEHHVGALEKSLFLFVTHSGPLSELAEWRTCHVALAVTRLAAGAETASRGRQGHANGLVSLLQRLLPGLLRPCGLPPARPEYVGVSGRRPGKQFDPGTANGAAVIGSVAAASGTPSAFLAAGNRVLDSFVWTLTPLTRMGTRKEKCSRPAHSMSPSIEAAEAQREPTGPTGPFQHFLRGLGSSGEYPTVHPVERCISQRSGPVQVDNTRDCWHARVSGHSRTSTATSRLVWASKLLRPRRPIACDVVSYAAVHPNQTSTMGHPCS